MRKPNCNRKRTVDMNTQYMHARARGAPPRALAGRESRGATRATHWQPKLGLLVRTEAAEARKRSLNEGQRSGVVLSVRRGCEMQRRQLAQRLSGCRCCRLGKASIGQRRALHSSVALQNSARDPADSDYEPIV